MLTPAQTVPPELPEWKVNAGTVEELAADDARTLPWVATAETIVVKDGVQVPATAITPGDRVTASGIVVKGKVASALKVVIHDAA